MMGVAPSSSEAQSLTSAERRSLRQGELVVRAERSRQGETVTLGGTSYQVIDAPLADVWAAMHDVRSIRDMLPQVHSARQVANSATERSVALRHRRGPVDVRYTMVFQYDEANHTVLFRLDESRRHDIEAGWGFIRLASYRGSKTLVSYGAMVGLRTGLISGALRPQLHEWVLKVPLTMKWFFDRRRSRG